MRFPPVCVLVLVPAIGILFGCSEADAPGSGFAAPARTGAEARAELANACRDALARDRRVLVEFSAAWCSDCQRLQEMKQASSLAEELAEWPNVTINVGMFDRHRDLLDHFGIEKIAHWSVFAPTDCAVPIERWPRLIGRTLEPSSGAERDTSPAQLAEWLRGFRPS